MFFRHADKEDITIRIPRRLKVMLSPSQNKCLHFYFSLLYDNKQTSRNESLLSNSNRNHEMEKFITPSVIKVKIVSLYH